MSDRGEEEKEVKLSIKHERFVNALLSGMSRSDAYLEAGYHPPSKNALWVGASRLYRNIKVQKELQRRRKEMEEEYRERMFDDVGEALDVRKLLLKSATREHSVRMAAVRDILDRAGFKPKEETDVGGTIKIIHEFVGATDGRSDDTLET